jgi:glycosyltransferase involved in cell wall biosynthesis
MKPLRILMVAPQPVLTPRGTPFSVMHRIRALTRLGHSVDLATYPFGEDMPTEGLRIFRCRRPFGVRDMPIGPSVRKIRADVNLAAMAWRMAKQNEYDLVHTHEEAGMFGAWLRKRIGIRHLYDMHSSLPQQFQNFGRYSYKPVIQLFERVENYTLNGSDGVIVICPALHDRAREIGYEGPLELIENTLDFEARPGAEARLPELRRQYRLSEGSIVVYTGSLERYQGLDLLLEAAALVADKLPAARFLVVGGSDADSRAIADDARSAGAGENVIAIPAVPPQDVQTYHRLADVLITTRTRGTNTPLKLYQYLRSGTAMLATSIYSHTQVLSEECAELVEPEAQSIADGVLRLIEDPERRAHLAAAAAKLALEQYGEETYHTSLQSIVEEAYGHTGPSEDTVA